MNSETSWVLEIDKSIFQDLKKLPRQDSKRILSEIKSLSLNPFKGDIRKIRGEDNIWRRRIGHYRIFYEVINSEKTIYVFHFERRSSKTY